MIAVWLVGPPRSVTIARTRAGSSPAVSAGARSAATSTDGEVGTGHAGFGRADEAREESRVDVAEVGDPLGHQPAHPGEDGHELLDGRLDGRQQRLAGLEVLADRGPEPAVGGEPGTGRQHLGGRAGGGAGLGAEPVGHLGRRVVVRRKGRVGVGMPAVAVGRDGPGGDVGGGDEDRPVGEAGHDRGAVDRSDHGHDFKRGGT